MDKAQIEALELVSKLFRLTNYPQYNTFSVPIELVQLENLIRSVKEASQKQYSPNRLPIGFEECSWLDAYQDPEYDDFRLGFRPGKDITPWQYLIGEYPDIIWLRPVRHT